ncbi:hypothetical protein [Piscinibacter koreensis]|uniref:Uncharacterized protein n=1 Tax=Piscinibacter koreensis TaxID=2742824 RepID=A0A7Y6TVD1_9BURK|nr:hypothetical protein [Schlegelella koreensis]NUZ04802.1 hypothetical protein [Schlegelella koreensis]
MDLKVQIEISDELADDVIKSTGMLDLASGEIRNVEYDGYDVEKLGVPAQRPDYEFTSGLLTNEGKDVEFGINVEPLSNTYSITPSELLELKVRAAKLFAGIAPSTLAEAPGSKSAAKPAAKKAARKTAGAKARPGTGDKRSSLH